MTPQIKKLLSALAVSAAGAILVTLNQEVAHLPIVWQGLAGSLLAGASHWLNAWGTKDEVNAKAAVIATEALDREV